jgi:hypothetical protein
LTAQIIKNIAFSKSTPSQHHGSTRKFHCNEILLPLKQRIALFISIYLHIDDEVIIPQKEAKKQVHI